MVWMLMQVVTQLMPRVPREIFHQPLVSALGAVASFGFKRGRMSTCILSALNQCFQQINREKQIKGKMYKGCEHSTHKRRKLTARQARSHLKVRKEREWSNGMPFTLPNRWTPSQKSDQQRLVRTRGMESPVSVWTYKLAYVFFQITNQHMLFE